MKVISSKPGSSRERVEAEADLLPVANWRVTWADAKPGFVRAAGRHLVLPSVWGADRSYELWLTEAEAIGIAKAVVNDLFDRPAFAADKHGSET